MKFYRHGFNLCGNEKARKYIQELKDTTTSLSYYINDFCDIVYKIVNIIFL
jgi:hypothetical protein